MLGSKISACFDFVAKVGQEVENLSDIIKEEMTRALTNTPLVEKYGILKWNFDCRYCDNDWICTDVICDVPLIVKPRRKPEMYLGFQISLLGSGMDTGGNRDPLVHVFCWRTGPASMKESPMAFPLEPDEQVLEDESLFVFGNKIGSPRSWAFTIALTDVNTIEDVRKKIIKPMRLLLLGSTAREALTGDIGGLICYEEIADKPGNYSVCVVEA